MPRATLEFNLPEESTEHRLAINGGRWQAAMWDLDMEMRGIVRDKVNARALARGMYAYQHEFPVGELLDIPDDHVRIVTEAWRSRLYAVLEDAGVTFDD